MRVPLALVIGFFVGLFHIHPVLQALVVLIVLDVLTGWMKAFVQHTISSSLSRQGIAKKATTLIIVSVAWVAENRLEMSFPIDLDITLAGFYCVTEVISILENAKAIGVPLPDVLMNRFEQFKKDQDARS